MLDSFRSLGCADVVVHHHGKGSASQTNIGYKARGSSVLAGWYDSHLSVEWADQKNYTVRLRFELRNAEAPEDMVLKLNPETLLFEVQTNEASQISLVVSTVSETGPASAQQVADRCSRTRQWASDWLNRATDQGKLTRTAGRPLEFALPAAHQVVNISVEAPPGIVVNTSTATESANGVPESISF